MTPTNLLNQGETRIVAASYQRYFGRIGFRQVAYSPPPRTIVGTVQAVGCIGSAHVVPVAFDAAFTALSSVSDAR